MDRPFLCQLSALNTHPSGASKPFALARAQRLQQFVQKLNLVDEVAHSRKSPLSRVEFLGEMSDVLHSYAPLPLIPPTPFSHTGLKGGGFAGRLSTVSVPPNARADPSVS